MTRTQTATRDMGRDQAVRRSYGVPASAGRTWPPPIGQSRDAARKSVGVGEARNYQAAARIAVTSAGVSAMGFAFMLLAAAALAASPGKWSGVSP